jgi:hypothetical protein
MQHGITSMKAQGKPIALDSRVAAGQVGITGLSGSSDQKAQVAAAIIGSSSLAKQGAASVIADKGFIQRVWDFVLSL